MNYRPLIHRIFSKLFAESYRVNMRADTVTALPPPFRPLAQAILTLCVQDNGVVYCTKDGLLAAFRACYRDRKCRRYLARALE